MADIPHVNRRLFLKADGSPSTVITSAGYDEATAVLAVELAKDGLVRIHRGVPAALWKAFETAPSPGTFYGRAVRSRYQEETLPAPVMGNCPACGAEEQLVDTMCLNCGNATIKP